MLTVLLLLFFFIFSAPPAHPLIWIKSGFIPPYPDVAPDVAAQDVVKRSMHEYGW